MKRGSNKEIFLTLCVIALLGVLIYAFNTYQESKDKALSSASPVAGNSAGNSTAKPVAQEAAKGGTKSDSSKVVMSMDEPDLKPKSSESALNSKTPVIANSAKSASSTKPKSAVDIKAEAKSKEVAKSVQKATSALSASSLMDEPESMNASASSSSSSSSSSKALASSGFSIPTNLATHYTIQSGDTFSHISERELGTVRAQPLLHKLNPEVDPDRLVVGKRLTLPSKEDLGAFLLTLSPPAPKGGKDANGAYVVKEGDNLYKICRELYGDIKRVKELEALNPLVDFSNMAIGTRLELPKN